MENKEMCLFRRKKLQRTFISSKKMPRLLRYFTGYGMSLLYLLGVFKPRSASCMKIDRCAIASNDVTITIDSCQRQK